MARYRADNILFIADRLIEAGEEFESDLPPGRNWHPLDEQAKANKSAMTFPEMPVPPGTHGTQRVEIPDNWREMRGLDLVNLARKLGLGKGGKDEAVKRIEYELAQRGMSAAA